MGFNSAFKGLKLWDEQRARRKNAHSCAAGKEDIIPDLKINEKYYKFTMHIFVKRWNLEHLQKYLENLIMQC